MPNFNFVGGRAWDCCSPNRQNLEFFLYINLPSEGRIPRAILTKFGMDKRIRVRKPFRCLAMWAGLRIVNIWNFCLLNFPQSVISLRRFLPNFAQTLGSFLLDKFRRYRFRNVELRPPKSPEFGIWGINLPIRGAWKFF